MNVGIAQSAAMISLIAVLSAGCQRYSQTSVSVEDARSHSVLRAEYSVPSNADLGDYKVLEVWAETDRESGEQQLIVRLKGPHHGSTPNVQVVGYEQSQYLSTWSERNGPPYEVWLAPDPLPESLSLQHGDNRIELTRRVD